MDDKVRDELPVAIGVDEPFPPHARATGLFLVADHDPGPGSHVEFTLRFDSPSGVFRLRGEGNVARLCRHGNRVVLGVRLGVSDSGEHPCGALPE